MPIDASINLLWQSETAVRASRDPCRDGSRRSVRFKYTRKPKEETSSSTNADFRSDAKMPFSFSRSNPENMPLQIARPVRMSSSYFPFGWMDFQPGFEKATYALPSCPPKPTQTVVSSRNVAAAAQPPSASLKPIFQPFTSPNTLSKLSVSAAAAPVVVQQSKPTSMEHNEGRRIARSIMARGLR